MIIYSVIGILISLMAYYILPRGLPGFWWKIYIACLFVHILVTLVYWQYAINFNADAKAYYFSTRWAESSLRPGTVFVAYTVRYLRNLFGGSFLDFFLLFQSFGMIGIAILMRSAIEISDDLGERLSPWLIALFFLPGLHFWTSAIGKDGPLFMSVSLTVWAAIRIEKRFPAFILAILFMAAFRPHVAAFAMLALLLALVLDVRVKKRFKIPLVLISLGALAAIASTISMSLNVSLFDPESVADFIASKQEYGTTSELGEGMGDLPIYLKIPSLLFRPFFFDARGVMGFIVSVENVVILAVFITLIIKFPTLMMLSARVPFVRYSLIFSATLIVVLSMVTYNVGLGLRQKYMIMPAILILFFTLISYWRASRSVSLRRVREGDPVVSRATS